jgi:hypothetical protein
VDGVTIHLRRRRVKPRHLGVLHRVHVERRPYACSDHAALPPTGRQLNADVLFATIERASSDP